jgi:hypothetical protein
MKEFMFFIRKQADSKETLSPVKHTEFLKSCQTYIEALKTEGRMISAQPIERSGEILSYSNGGWTKTPFNESKEVIGGYYHILAESLDEAISTAMKNPEFEYNPGTRIEVRPIKMKEDVTGFVYPAK